MSKETDLDFAKYELKIRALTERMSELVASYEGTIADLRVLVTVMSQNQGEEKDD